MKFFIKKISAYLYFFLYKFALVKKIYIEKRDVRFFEKIGSSIESITVPKIVWMFWDGELPYEIECFYQKIKNENISWDVRILNFETLCNYIQDDIDWKNLDMPIANVTDYIRIRLIHDYGGVWLDSSIILNVSLDELFRLNNPFIYDYMGFYRDVSTTNRDCPVIESWCFIAPQGNRFVKKVLDIYEPVLTLGSSNYYLKLKERDDFTDICQKISPPEYLIYYIAVQIALKEYKNVNLFLYCADDSAYLIQDTIGWRSHKATAYLFMNDAPKERPMLYKLTHGDRQFFEVVRRKQFMNKSSIMGEIV